MSKIHTDSASTWRTKWQLGLSEQQRIKETCVYQMCQL